MPLAEHLACEHVVVLEAATKGEALRELAEQVSAGVSGLDAEAVLDAVQARERDIGTAIEPGVALPHARLPGMNRCVIAVGLSRRGIPWGTSIRAPVHLVVMLLGGTEDSRGYIAVLAEVASILRGPELLARAKDIPSAAALYDLLVEVQRGAGGTSDDREHRHNRALFAHACAVAVETGASALILHGDDRLDLGFVERPPPGLRLILATRRVRKGDEPGALFDAVLEVPETGIADSHRLEFDLVLALSQGLLEDMHQIVCVWGRPRSGRLDSLSVVDIDADYQVLMSLRSEMGASDVAPQVLNRVLGIAGALAAEGREGKPLGTILVVGDYEGVAAYCQQMVINPFKGYPDEQKTILDPSLEETIKEFAAIDGAFVIRGDGVVMSAGTYLAAEGIGIDVPKGLGTRHTAAAAMTAVTSALAVVISESTGTVSLFMRGKLLLQLKQR